MRKTLKRLCLALAAGFALASCSVTVEGTKGPTGDPGQPGSDGRNGSDALSAYEEYISKHPEYTGDEEQWMDDLVHGRLAEYGLYEKLIFSDVNDEETHLIGCYSADDEITIPAYVNGKKVTGIESMVFSYKMVKKINLPDTIESIGYGAFAECEALEEVNGALHLKMIDIGAFADCGSLSSFDFGDSLEYIGMNAFYGTNFDDLLLPSTIRSIGATAFCQIASLKRVVIEEGMDSIGQRAFFGCSALEEAYLPKGISTVGSDVFFGCPNVHVYCAEEEQPASWSPKWKGNISESAITWGYQG